MRMENRIGSSTTQIYYCEELVVRFKVIHNKLIVMNTHIEEDIDKKKVT